MTTHSLASGYSGLWTPIAIAIGGALGCVVRFYSVQWIRIHLQSSMPIPIGNLLVNATGCFLVGAVYAFVMSKQIATEGIWMRLVMVGFLGGFTTFSAFTLEVWMHMQGHGWLTALKMVLLHLGATLVATAGGFILVRNLL